MKVIREPRQKRGHVCDLEDPGEYDYKTVVECSICHRQYIRKLTESAVGVWPIWLRKFWRVR